MTYDIAIIGAGPGGYTAAIRAAQLGMAVILVEKDQPGGVCLNRGCIPSKAIITSVDRYTEAKRLHKFGIKMENLSYDYGEIFQEKEKLVKKLVKSLSQVIKANGIDYIKGEACIESKNSLKVISETSEQAVEFKNLIIATGSRPCSLPNIKLDHKFVLDTDDVLSMEDLPESALIVGSGASGIEWARIFSGLEKQVTLVEIAPKLAPSLDNSISEAIRREFKKKKVEAYTATSIEEIDANRVLLSNGQELTPDIVFLGAGRVPNTEIKGVEQLDPEMNGKFFKVDSNLRTSIDNIYAIGDVNGILQVAHAASHQGVRAVEHIKFAQQADIDYTNIPFVIYGHPEIASLGYAEDVLMEKGIPYKKSVFPMPALGKTLVERENEGFIKVLADEENILGVHIISGNASELIHQLAIAKSAGISPEILSGTVFAHPTYSEAVYEGILGLVGDFFHLPPGLKTRI